MASGGPKWLYDGSLSFERGMDGGRASTALADTNVAYATNATFRGGYPRPRPQIRLLEYGVSGSFETYWANNKFQGASGYTDSDGKGYVFISVGGRLYSLSLDDYLPNIVEHTTTTLENNPNNEQAWFCQAENYLLVQDGRASPWLWDGTNLTRITPGQIPVGTRMAYGIGRLWVAAGSSYYGGDLIDSDPSLGKASILHFTENDYLNEGGAFNVPANAGQITGLSFTAKQDTVSGQGSLMVFTQTAIFEFDAPVDRATWSELRQPLQRFSLLNFGATSHESIVPVNGDLFFRSLDGVRSFYFARRDFGSWGNTPISRELGTLVSRDNRYWLKSAKSVLFDNRLLTTSSPVVTDRGVVWEKVLSLDFDLIAGMAEKYPPAWEGEWSFGQNLSAIVTVGCKTGQRCILVFNDDTYGITFYEILPDGHDVGESFTWGIDTKAYQCGQPMELKRLQTFESWWDNQISSGNIDVWWRPNASGCWSPWGRYVSYVVDCSTTPPADCDLPTFSGGEAKNRVGLPLAPDLHDTTNCVPRRDGYSHQLRLRCTHKATLKMLRIGTQIVDVKTTPDFDNNCTALTETCETCT